MKKKTIWDLQRMSADEFRKADKLPLVLVLDNVRSLSNVGAMLRTADAFGLEKVMLCGVTGTPPSPEIHKTALGAEDSVDWQHAESTVEVVDSLRREGYTVCVLEQVQNSVMLQDFCPEPGRCYAIVVGHEVNGVDQNVVDRADVCLEIPQFGTKHSMNVSVSAGIALWQLVARLV